MVGMHSNNAAQTNQANYVFMTLPASTVAPEVLVTSPAITAAPNMLVSPPAIVAAAPEHQAPVRENTPVAGTVPSSSPSVSCTPIAVCVASTLPISTPSQ